MDKIKQKQKKNKKKKEKKKREKNPEIQLVSYLEFLVRAESEDSESVDNVLLEGWLLLVGGREGRFLAGPRGSRWPGRPRVSVPRMTGLGTEAAAAAGGVLVLAAVAVLLVVWRPLPRLLRLLLLLRGGQALPLRQHALRSLPSSILLATLLRLDLHLRVTTSFSALH